MASCKKGEAHFRALQEKRKGCTRFFFFSFYYMKKYLFYINMRLPALEISFLIFCSNTNEYGRLSVLMKSFEISGGIWAKGTYLAAVKTFRQIFLHK